MVTVRSWAMSASGLVTMRAVNPVPAVEKPPVVMPALKISPGAVVVTVPVAAVALVPVAEVPTSKGLVVARPLYSVARMST